MSIGEVGTFKQFFLVFSVTQVFFSGFPNIITHYYPNYLIGHDPFFIKWFNKRILLVPIIALLIVFLLLFFNKNINFSYSLVIIIAFNVFANIYLTSIINALISKKEINRTSIIYFWKFLTSIFSFFLFYISDKNYLIYYLSFTLMLILIAFNNNSSLIDLKKKSVKSDKYDKFLFSISLTLIGTNLSIFLDKYLISFLVSNEEFAIFNYGKFQVPFVTMILTSTMLLFLPKLNLSFSNNKFCDFKKIWKEQIIFLCIIYHQLLFGIIFFSKEIILILFGSQYIDSVLIFQISSLKYLVTFTSFALVFNTVKKPMVSLRWSIYYGLMTLAIFILFEFLFIDQKLLNAVLSSTLSFFVAPIYFSICIKKQLKTNPLDIIPLKFILKNLLLLLSIWIVPFVYFFKDNILLKLVICVSAFSLYFLIMKKRILKLNKLIK